MFPEVGDRDAQIALYRKNLELIDQSRIWDAFGGDPGAVGPTELWRPLRPARSAEAEDRKRCELILELLKIPCSD